MEFKEIINKLPYSHPFLFVDELLSVSEDGITGTYLFNDTAYFYQGHFKKKLLKNHGCQTADLDSSRVQSKRKGNAQKENSLFHM